MSTTYFPKSTVGSYVVGNNTAGQLGLQRLYNYSGQGGASQSLGNLTSAAGRDLGALMPNWSTDIEDAIVEAILAGKRIRTSACFQIYGIKDNAENVADCDILIGFYHTGNYIFRHQVLMSVHQQEKTSLACLAGEFYGTVVETTLDTEEANVSFSNQEQFTPPDAIDAYNSITNSQHVNGLISELDGKFICYTVTNSNLVAASSTLALRYLTIDILS